MVWTNTYSQLAVSFKKKIVLQVSRVAIASLGTYRWQREYHMDSSSSYADREVTRCWIKLFGPSHFTSSQILYCYWLICTDIHYLSGLKKIASEVYLGWSWLFRKITQTVWFLLLCSEDEHLFLKIMIVSISHSQFKIPPSALREIWRHSYKVRVMALLPTTTSWQGCQWSFFQALFEKQSDG